jgi:hypothetical protein
LLSALAALAGVGFSGYSAAGTARAGQGPVDPKTLVTRPAIHGIPYAEARAYCRQAIPALVVMLHDPSLEDYWDKIIYVLGCIGDPAATGPLMDFLKSQQGEISVQTFRATLAVLPALGHIARGGDRAAFTTITDFTQADQWQKAGLGFSYGRYRGEALGEVLGRTAIQGLGITGTTEALGALYSLGSDPALRPDWHDNVEEAVSLNLRIGRLGADAVFSEVQP